MSLTSPGDIASGQSYRPTGVDVDYRWRCQDARGRDVPGEETVFADQTAAEDWLTDSWRDLLAAGVDRVTLLHGDAEVYGPMSLHSA